MKIISILFTLFYSYGVGSLPILLPDKTEVNLQYLQQKFTTISHKASFDTKTIEGVFKIYDQQYSKVKTNPNGNKIAPDRAADCLRVKNAEYDLAESKLKLNSFLSSFAGVPIAQLYAYFLLKKHRSDLKLADEHYTQCMNGNN